MLKLGELPKLHSLGGVEKDLKDSLGFEGFEVLGSLFGGFKPF